MSINLLFIIMYKSAEFKRTAEHCQGITNSYWAGVCWMHVRFVIVAEKDDIEMIVILHIADGLICKKGGVCNGDARLRPSS